MQLSSDRLHTGVIPGDGIGPEVIAQGLKALEALAHLNDLRPEITRLPYGAEHVLATGEVGSEEWIEASGDVRLSELAAGWVGEAACMA